jgi:putative (di)nucleoside polyphosphate hydrolase
MTQPHSDLPYRKSVGLCIFNAKGLVLCAERRDRPGAWQMPQGGIQKDEAAETAVFREMKEEVGTDNARIVGRAPEILRYEFPDFLQYRHGIFRGKYRGQEQIWFALLYTGADSEISLAGEHEPELPEFINWRWAPLAETPGMIVDFKRHVYESVVTTFKSLEAALQRGETLPAFS